MYAFGMAMPRLVMPEPILYVYCYNSASMDVKRLRIASGQARIGDFQRINLSNSRIGCIYYLKLYYMAEVFAPFLINRTIRNLTFYSMEGRNFVRKKSSLSRRKVLYSPQFKNTRHFAGLMGKASKIGSLVFNALPEYWRQGWMYRSFTGEAFSMLKAGKKEREIQQVLWERYVKEVVNRRPKEAMAQLNSRPKRAYQKLNSTYWKRKTIKSSRRKANRQRLMHNAGLMAQASKTGAKLYAQLPRKYAGRPHYQYLTGLAFKLLKLEISEEAILAELRPTLPSVNREHKAIRMKPANIVNHPNGQYHFIPSLRKRSAAAAVNGVVPVINANHQMGISNHRANLVLRSAVL